MEAIQAQNWIRPQDLSCNCQETTSELLVAVSQCRIIPYPLTGFAWVCAWWRVSLWHMKGCLKRISEASFTFHFVAMAIVVDVTLISGQRVSLEADLIASVQSLAESARRAPGVGRGRLFSASGSILDADAQLGAAKLQTGDCLMLLRRHMGQSSP